MAPPFRPSWLCALLCGCLCFPPQKGYNVAHGYYLYESPQTSSRLHSGQSLNANNEDEKRAMGQQSFVSLQREPFPYDKGQDATPEMKQSQPDKFYGASSAPPIQLNEQSGYHHPIDLLVRGRTQQPVNGVSFPTMSHLKQFIEIMRSSFLVPGSDLSRHFKTAREKIKNLGTSMDYTSTSEKEGTAYGDSSKNKDQIEQGAKYQMPDERLSFPDPVDSSARLISSSVYDNQKFRPGTVLYPHNHLAATDLASRNVAHGFRQRNNTYVNVPENEQVQSEKNNHPEKMQFPSRSFFGQDSLYSGHHVTATPVNPPNSPSEDFSYYLSKTSTLAPYKNILNPAYASRSKDSLMRYWRPSGGFELTKDFHRATQADVLSPKDLPSVYSYGKKHDHSMEHYWSKDKTRMAPSVQAYQPTESKELRVIEYTPNIHQPVSSGSVSLSFNDLLPQWSTGHMGYQTSRPQYPQIPVFKQKQMDRSHWRFTAKPSSFLRGSRKNNGHLGHQKVSIGPSVLNAQAKDEKSDLYNQNPVFDVQKQSYNESSGRDSPQSAVSSYGGRNALSSFYKPQRQTMRAGRLQPFTQPNVWMPPARASRQPRNLAKWPPEPWLKPKGLMSECVIKRNTKSLPPQESQNTSPSLNPFVKSKNRFTRATAYLSKVCYTPYKVQGKTAKDQWSLAIRDRE